MTHPSKFKKKKWELANVEGPEKRLLCAIIERAWLDLDSLDRRERREARAWFLTKDKGDWTFHWMAQQLELTEKIMVKLIDVAVKSKLNFYH